MPSGRLVPLAVALLLGPGALRAAAQTPAVVLDASLVRTRGADREARSLIDLAITRSPTAARLIATLETSDLIVFVEVCPLPSMLGGETRLLTATSEVRYVRIRIRSSGGLFEQISVLGHELQHAAEIAAAPEVRDQAAQAVLYRRIGFERAAGVYFKTHAALTAGWAVAKEISRQASR